MDSLLGLNLPLFHLGIPPRHFFDVRALFSISAAPAISVIFEENFVVLLFLHC